jgi:quercetin dioxygenase-like cupin family protein
VPFNRSSTLSFGLRGPSRNRGNKDMLDRIMSGVGRTTTFSGLVLGALLGALSTASAGTCPADQMKTDVRAPVTHAAKGVTDTVLGAIDLAKEPAAIKDRQLRFRKLTIEPGGIVPWHSHGDRPAIIFIQEGEIIEYASNCAVPIVHKTGDIRPETNPTSHWWENKGSKTVVLYVGDVLHDKTDKNM